MVAHFQKAYPSKNSMNNLEKSRRKKKWKMNSVKKKKKKLECFTYE